MAESSHPPGTVIRYSDGTAGVIGSYPAPQGVPFLPGAAVSWIWTNSVTLTGNCIISSSELATSSGDKLGSAHFTDREDDPETWCDLLTGTQLAGSGLVALRLSCLLLPCLPLPRGPSASQPFILAAGAVASGKTRPLLSRAEFLERRQSVDKNPSWQESPLQEIEFLVSVQSLGPQAGWGRADLA